MRQGEKKGNVEIITAIGGGSLVWLCVRALLAYLLN